MLAPALIVSLLVGTALGQKFKVFVLGPIFALAGTLAVIMTVAHPQDGWRIAETTLITIFGLQVGYILGIAVRNGALLLRAHRLRSVSLRDSNPSRRPAH